jgi:membrane-bound ClpP family serine protease
VALHCDNSGEEEVSYIKIRRGLTMIKSNLVLLLLWVHAIGMLALGLFVVSIGFGIIGYPVALMGLAGISLLFPSLYSDYNNKKKKVKIKE